MLSKTGGIWGVQSPSPAGRDLGWGEPLLTVGRHLRLFKGHVLAHNWIVLLQFQFALRRALVLLRVVRKTSTGGRNEANIFAHSGPLVPRRPISGKPLT